MPLHHLLRSIRIIQVTIEQAGSLGCVLEIDPFHIVESIMHPFDMKLIQIQSFLESLILTEVPKLHLRNVS